MRREHVGDDLHAAVDGLGEVLLLDLDDAGDIVLFRHEVRVGDLVFVDDRVADLIEEGVVDAEEFAVPRGAAEETAQNVAAALVRGEDAVRDHHGGGADMVGDDAQGRVDGLGLAVARTGDLADLVGDAHDGVDIEQGVDALTHDGQTFEAHAGVDVFLDEIGIVAVAVVVELGENDVPDLDIAVTVAAGAAGGAAAAVLLAAVKVDLGAGAARAGAVLPEVVLLAETGDLFGGHADLVAPDGKGLVVVDIDGGVKALRIHADPLRRGQKFPRPGEGFVLEVVAEGEVAQHLEIGAVAGGVADVFDVAGADALLAGRDAAAGRLLFAGEPGLHRGHAGVDEQQRSVVLRNEREARQAQMAFALKKGEVFFSQLV